MHLSEIEAVAFDMDGLMFDTESVYWKAADALLRRRGHVYTQELCEAIMGRPPKDCYIKFIETYGLSETWQQLQKESEEIFLGILENGFDVMPGLFELLNYLEEQKIRKGICTSSAKRVVSRVLELKGLQERFQFVLTAEDITHGKPNPEIYLKAAEHFGISPSKMLVLEDSVFGGRAAMSAGAQLVIVRAEHNRNFDFTFAATVINSLKEISPTCKTGIMR